MLRRFLVGALCFVLGFATCIASIVGVGWFAYSKISLESLEKAGLVEVDENSFRDPEAEVDITKLTLKGLVAELGELSKLSEPVSIDTLIERYRLKLPEETLKLLPAGVRSLPLEELLSGDGADKLLAVMRVEDLYPFLPADLLSEPAKEALAGKTLGEVATLNLGNLLSDVKLGYLLGVKYEKNTATGEYEPIYRNPDQPTMPELLSEVNAAELLDLFANGGDIAEIFGKYMNDALVSHFFGSFMDLSDFPLGGVLEGKTFGDVLAYDEASGSYNLVLSELLGGSFAELFGFTPIYHDETAKDFIIGWTDKNGEPVYGIMRGMATVSPSTLLLGSVDVAVLLADVYLGDVLSYRPTFDDEGNITVWRDADGNAASGIMEPLVSLKLGEITDGSFDFRAILDGVYVGDLLSYTPVKDDPLDPDRITGWTKDGASVKGIDLAMANIDLGRLLGDDTYEIGSAFDSLLLGELLGYERRDGVWYEAAGSANKVSELYATVADLSIGSLISGESDLESVLSGLYLGDLLNYEKTVDGGVITWCETRKDAGGNLILDGAGNPKLFPVSALYARIADLTVGEMTSADFSFASIFDGLCLGEVLGYTHDGAWYETKSDGTKGEKLGGVDAALAEIDLGDLLSGEGFDMTAVFKNVYLGEALGYEKGEKLSGDGEAERYRWYKVQKNPDGTTTRLGEIDGIESRISSYKLGALIDGSAEIKTEDLIKGMTIGEILGYTPYYRIDGEGALTDEIEYWCDSDGNRVTGLMAAIAGEEVTALSDGTLMSKIKLGDALDYYYDSGKGAWLVSAPTAENPNPDRVGGIMGVLADKKVSQLSTAIDGVYIGEIMGYVEKAGTWYEVYDESDPSRCVKASGVMAAFAGLTVAEMSNSSAVSSAINDVALGEALGYYYNSSNGKWYASKEPGAAVVDGVMGALADTKIGGLSARLESAKIGELLGYTYDGGVWKDGETAVAPIINKICGATFDTLNSTLDHLTLGDIFTDADLSSGFLALLGGDLASRKAIELNSVPSEATTAIQSAKIGSLMACGILNIDPIAQGKLDLLSSGWRDLTIEQFINFVVGH